MQFPNPIVAELHLIGTGTRVDIDGLGGNQPTIWFSNTDRTVSSFINAPSSGSPITFMGLAMDGSTWTSANLPGNPVLRSRVFISLGLIDIGNVIASSQGTIGGRIQLFDNNAVMYFTPGPNSAATTARISVTDAAVTMQGTTGSNGVLFDAATAALRAHNAGVKVQWQGLTLANGWTNRGGGFQTAQFVRMPDGTVMLRGQILPGTTTDGTVIATLPSDFIPAEDNFPITAYIGDHNTTAAILAVGTNGDLKIFNVAATTFVVSIGGVQYSTLT